MMAKTPNQPHCLVVEDQALIAMSVEAYLEDAGFEVQTVGSIAQAQALLSGSTPAFVILDFMLKDGLATGVAFELRGRGIPFIVYSGYPRHAGLPSLLQEVPWLEKPTRREDLLKAVVSLSLTETSVPTLNS